MIYTVHGWYHQKGTGEVSAESHDRLVALEEALDLKRQGVERIEIRDQTGRSFTLSEFEAFCAGR